MEGMYFCRAKDGLQINTIRFSVYVNEGIFRFIGILVYRQMLEKKKIQFILCLRLTTHYHCQQMTIRICVYNTIPFPYTRTYEDKEIHFIYIKETIIIKLMF